MEMGTMNRYSPGQLELFMDAEKREIIEYALNHNVITEYTCTHHGWVDLEAYFDYDEIVGMNTTNEFECPLCLEEITGAGS
jgi:hypothetical protein